MWPTRELYTAGLIVFALGATGGIVSQFLVRTARWMSWLFCGTALAGTLLEGAASIGGLVSGSALTWVLPSGVPYITCSIRLDALALFFLLTLSILAASVAVYSIGYLRHGPAGRNPALSSALLNLLLASLTLVFTASDVMFFLIVWEVMVAAAYFLVVTNHESGEVRGGGFVY